MAERHSPPLGRIGRTRLTAAALCGLALLAAAAPGSLYADPPPWSPAYGERAKGGGRADGQTDLQLTYRLPAGLQDGRCRPEMFDTSVPGGLISAVAGGFAEPQPGKGRGRLSATAIGALIGAVAGHQTGDGIARSEEVCFSQSFEHVPDRETVAWTDHALGAHYAVTPTKTLRSMDGRFCREYTARATVNGQAAGTYGTACRQSDGSWELIN